jgi:hypothetical protein
MVGGRADEAEDRARRTQIVLDAVAAMARRSARSQADVRAALYKVGLTLPEPELAAILAELVTAGLVENLIPLIDGSVLLTVTTLGVLASRRRR